METVTLVEWFIAIVILLTMTICIMSIIFARQKELKKYYLDKTYIFKKNGDKYKVLEISGFKMKNPTTGEWSECVIYQSHKNHEFFVRDKKDFQDKFVSVYEVKNNPEFEEYKKYLEN